MDRDPISAKRLQLLFRLPTFPSSHAELREVVRALKPRHTLVPLDREFTGTCFSAAFGIDLHDHDHPTYGKMFANWAVTGGHLRRLRSAQLGALALYFSTPDLRSELFSRLTKAGRLDMLVGVSFERPLKEYINGHSLEVDSPGRVFSRSGGRVFEHAGIVVDSKRIESKWGMGGPFFQHAPLEVPINYGCGVTYFEHPGNSEIRRIHGIFASEMKELIEEDIVHRIVTTPGWAQV